MRLHGTVRVRVWEFLWHLHQEHLFHRLWGRVDDVSRRPARLPKSIDRFVSRFQFSRIPNDISRLKVRRVGEDVAGVDHRVDAKIEQSTSVRPSRRFPVVFARWQDRL